MGMLQTGPPQLEHKGTGTPPPPALLLQGWLGAHEDPPQPAPELKCRDTAEPESSPVPLLHHSIPPACKFATAQGKFLCLHHSSTHRYQPQTGEGRNTQPRKLK